MSPSEQIRAVRESTGLSQEEFAETYELPVRELREWEDGVSAPPYYILQTLDLAVRIYPPESLREP